MIGTDIISLKLPKKAEYVGTARLMASGLANRLGFDIDAIEDIKVALSEVCTKLINNSSNEQGHFEITFELNAEGLKIFFFSEDKESWDLFENSDELGVAIIQALMDDVEVTKDKPYVLSMYKAIEERVDG